MRAVLFALLLLPGFAQQKPEIVPITSEPMHHLVLENQYFRVFDVTVPPHSQTKYHQHDHDYLFVTLGDTDVESTRVGEKPVRLQLNDGAVRFTKGSFAHKAMNIADTPFHNITIEVKDAGAAPACGRAQCEVSLSIGGEKGSFVQELGIGRLHWSTFRQQSRRRGFFAFAKNLSALIVPIQGVDIKSAKSNETRHLAAGQVFWKNKEDELRVQGSGLCMLAIWVEDAAIR